MSSANSNHIYAVCIRTCELIGQMEQIGISRLLVGDLVEICKVYYSDCDRCIIKVFDRDTRCFRRTLNRCEKENLCVIPSNMWPFIHDIAEGSVVKVRMALSCGQQAIVNFQVKFFGEIPVGGDQFYGLQMMPTPNLSKENVTELNKTYLSPTLSLIILRADRLIMNLVVNEENGESSHIEQNTHRTEKTIYLSDPDKNAYDFVLLPFSDIKPKDFHSQPNPPQSQKQTTISNVIRQNGCTSADPTSSNIKIFVLPKISEHEKNCSVGMKKSRKIERQSSRECKINCFGCGKNEETPIQFNCLHIFCSECLMNSFNDHSLDDLYCPFNKRNYNCRYKITADDVQHILDIINGKSIEKRNSSKPKSFLHKCTRCQFISKTDGRYLYQCTNCKIWNSLDIQNDIDYEETPSRPPPPVPTSALSVCETWSCTYCHYNENRIDSNKCVICNKTNDKLLSKSNTCDYYELLELEGNDTFIPNFKQFYCVFCDQTIAPDNGVVLRSCLHNICLKCIVSYIERQDLVEIKCPHSMCKCPIQQREIKSLITPETYANHLEKSLNIGKMNLENGYQCCTPGCDGFWVFDDVNVKYICPKCNKENCIQCKASHSGIECSLFKAQPK